MSELMNAQGNGRDFRWQLLTTVSAAAVFSAVYGASPSRAADQDADRPTVWIELGGDLDRITGQGDVFTPAFLSANPTSSILQQKLTPTEAQNPPPFAFGEEGKISFQPESSDWVFAASVRYGRSGSKRNVHHQTTKVHYPQYISGLPTKNNGGSNYFTQENFATTQIRRQESHVILDFQAGKDVGLGLFGRHAVSTLSLGVRFAQFASKATFDIRARPDLHWKYFPSAGAPTKFVNPYFHTYHATGNATRSFRGVGPSLSWNASAPFVGNPQNGEVTFDWGINASLLFGKQKARVQHQQTGRYWPKNGLGVYGNSYLVTPTSGGHDNVRAVTVPNIGGFAGMSFEFSSAKVSVGYRADLFFNAMDVGIDKSKSETLGFYGPFASVSVGLL